MMSKRGASLGGLARAEKLSPKRRIEIARAAGVAAGIARHRKNKSL